MANDVVVRFGADIGELQEALQRVRGEIVGLGEVKGSIQSLAGEIDSAANSSKNLVDKAKGVAESEKEKNQQIERDKKDLYKILESEHKSHLDDLEKQAKESYKKGEISEREEADIIYSLHEEEHKAELEVWKRYEEEGLIEKDKYELEKAVIDKKYAAIRDEIHRQNVDDIAKKYEEIAVPIGGAMGGVVGTMISQHKTLKQAISAELSSIAKNYLASAAKSSASWMSHKLAEMALDKTDTQQKIANDNLKTASGVSSDAARTSATMTGVATRKAAESSESTGFLSQIGSTLSRWFGVEQAKTAATTTGVAERTGVVTAGTAQQTAAEVGAQGAQTAAVVAGDAARTASGEAAAVTEEATQSAGIFRHAGSAAASVYDNVSQIPYVGWLLAPAAAATAFGAVAAFSAEGGWDRVPYDGAMTELHKDEMVLPAAIAETVRAASASIGGQGLPRGMNALGGDLAMPNMAAGQAGAQSGSAMTVHYSPQVSSIDTRGARDFLDQHGRYIVDVLSRHHRNFAQVPK